jgi:hypothetical protein
MRVIALKRNPKAYSRRQEVPVAYTLSTGRLSRSREGSSRVNNATPNKRKEQR